jgi:HPr kinase/phosphorylase
MTAVSARALFESQEASFRLRWLAGRSGGERRISMAQGDRPGASLIGHLNFIHPNVVQVIGSSELHYLRGLGKNSRADAIAQLCSDGTALILIADRLRVPADLREAADRSGVPLFGSELPSSTLIDKLQYHLGNLLAEKVTVHGVFMEVMGIGVLITGEASVGKSELALELVTRGHRLVADDAPEFAHIVPDVLNGSCPEPLQSFLEVRGIGLLNVRAMFGDSAVKTNKYLRLIVHLKPMSEEELREIDRLQGSRRMRRLLDVEVPEITLPVAPGRNLAVLVEAAVRNHVLKLKGYDAAADFSRRQQRYME